MKSNNFLLSHIKKVIFYDTYAAGGNRKYKEVTAFMKKQPTLTALYKSITTSCNKTVRLSEDHLIYARQGYAETFYAV